MNNKLKKIILFLILSGLVFFLSACDTDADYYELENAFEAWADKNGLFKDGEWQPEGVVKKAVEDTIGDITNADENTQFDGLEVIHTIEKADELANYAIATNEHEKMEEAIKLRPEDWRLHEQNAVLWLINSNSASTVNAQTKSDDLLIYSIQRGGDCVALRKQQLEFRAKAIRSEFTNCEISRKDICNLSALEDAEFSAREELQGIYATGKTPFCNN